MRKIPRPDLVSWTGAMPKLISDKFNDWYDEHCEPINAALDAGVEVRMSKTAMDYPIDIYADDKFNKGSTHKALLIGIEPIVEESLKDVAMAMIDSYENNTNERNEVYYKRLKAALAREGNNGEA